MDTVFLGGKGQLLFKGSRAPQEELGFLSSFGHIKASGNRPVGSPGENSRTPCDAANLSSCPTQEHPNTGCLILQGIQNFGPSRSSLPHMTV
jgi:hypothetical protein